MKKLFLNSFYLFSFILIFSSCSSDDDNSTTSSIQTDIENSIQVSNWRVTKFIDSGDDETNNYNGYSFTFNSDSSLVATNGTNTYTGSWSVTDSNSSSNSSSDLDFNISFTSPPDFEELSDDWDIITNSASKIELIDVSGGNGGTDYLTFEKN